MINVDVYHADVLTDELTHVATVEADAANDEAALNMAYRLTQNWRGSWSRGPVFEDTGERNPDHHPAVTRQAPLWELNGKVYGLRSSMVGDRFVINGTAYRVSPVGFTREEASDAR